MAVMRKFKSFLHLVELSPSGIQWANSVGLLDYAVPNQVAQVCNTDRHNEMQNLSRKRWWEWSVKD